ncbi:endoplasmic reticulum-Golgi intermediate compartment protein 2 [Rhinichthys klamathensis goyatoka]|uniref:endoplasmic reticulum-Golgi intermediate compartment protein 2 n=1 Tax=Rhinichthys klamathensis goyatoka TaxID=3034132 RepID=UPI0024B52B4D|nr:endoplasmic reticulum-Golgi intermediate compartment protein 2 [Rhinichthys klamathensis goyatoka]XP_056124826.1 endoplasmic reticulum-Golgi intermediate compartment protein 2 [Rhinichthys klamathensis goyatoka]
MRRLSRRNTIDIVKELDGFPKVSESCVVTSAFGGTVSLIVFILMALLAISEYLVYQDTWMKYEYEVDTDFTSKLKIKIDITVAMKCEKVGADVLDIAGTVIASKELKYDPVSFEPSPQRQMWYQILQQIQNRLREERSLQDVLFKSALKGYFSDPVPGNDSESESQKACRIHGQIYVSKLAGNFHITLGKPIETIKGHAHFALLIKNEAVYNFSHRIDHLSFGNDVPGHINPLDGTEKIASEQNMLFQYFITVVPTKLHTSDVSVDMHQFSVTERERVVSQEKGSHGVFGIFVKYKLSPLMVRVSEEHMPLSVFLVRLCGIIGGIFSTSDLLHRLIGYFVDIICCRFKLGANQSKEVSHYI